MKVRVKWVEEVSFLAQSESGHSVLMDGPPAGGGRNLGPRPMEMVLMGTAGCSTYDVIHILKKSRADVRDCVVDVEAERAETEPKVFTKIHLHYTVTGKGLKPEQVERAIKLSAEKYCSASIMLAKSVLITHDFEVIEAA
ncbi:OsmC family protein [Iodobacter sp. CM08]|uniref:OsmC family protein n=1 Tax=Iodobacter sp. CM08 TaxID=3085902 RepID=UPI00298271C2|nr:OsmC family protein [Iodobacter sp. CM08]MDW5416912.1 OsmC family protein [Iodobacter sp. CM08]